MIEFKGWVSGGTGDRYAGYDRTVGLICWLLVALIVLYIRFLPVDRPSALLLGASCLVLVCYRSLATRFLSSKDYRGPLDQGVLLLFVFIACWSTGSTGSPFLCFLYLLLVIASLTSGRKITYLMAAASSLCYLGLALAHQVHGTLPAKVAPLLPFVLTAYLAALLARESEKAHAEVERLSLTDDLTDLNNMRSFHNLANQQEKLARRYHKPFSICMLDADNLKEINDRHGHLAGTELIKWTGRIIRENTRECDIAARFGGDEFIIMYEGHDKEQIRPAVERIVRAMAAAPFVFEGLPVYSTLSGGIASFPADGADLRSVIIRADEAMYRSKRLGKNTVSLWQEGEKKGRGALQVRGEQLGRPVPELRRKSAAVHLGERDLTGGGEGNGASFLKDAGKS